MRAAEAGPPGDTLSGRVTIAEVAPPRGGRARVRIRGELANQHDERVMIIELDGYVRSRGNTAAAPTGPLISLSTPSAAQPHSAKDL
ncbi:hypothetical protein K7711_36915 [Nocardia sp. CA2R105]|uniref:hypothetical protein n=1 Tax=Nocardia coffeae TaxID=2873381 RepID=UPI001CA60AB8|nr:hypothetical protein [Nocardia coffeae]MBY8862105.1 hypothetical protein [Nocardia coffeae]